MCNWDCGFLAYVSRVGATFTYRMKTLKPKHTCGSVFYDKNVKSGWVAKVVTNKVRSNNKFKMSEIQDEIRRANSIRITT